MDAKPATDRYRHAVDRGKTHDKVPAPDPATVPLEADAESGGQPTSEQQLETVLRDQARQPVREAMPATSSVPGRGQTQIPARANAWWMGGGLVILVVLGAATAILTFGL